MKCPRCEGQRYDKGSCLLCGNYGYVCPECAGRLARSPFYSGGRNQRGCIECGRAYVDMNEDPQIGKLISLRLGAGEAAGEEME